MALGKCGGKEGSYSMHDPIGIYEWAHDKPILYLCSQCGITMIHVERYPKYILPIWQYVEMLKIIEWP